MKNLVLSYIKLVLGVSLTQTLKILNSSEVLFGCVTITLVQNTLGKREKASPQRKIESETVLLIYRKGKKIKNTTKPPQSL